MHGMDITHAQIAAIRNEGLGYNYEVSSMRPDGTIIVEFFSFGDRLKKIRAIAPDGTVTRDTHI